MRDGVTKRKSEDTVHAIVCVCVHGMCTLGSLHASPPAVLYVMTSWHQSKSPLKLCWTDVSLCSLSQFPWWHSLLLSLFFVLLPLFSIYSSINIHYSPSVNTLFGLLPSFYLFLLFVIQAEFPPAFVWHLSRITLCSVKRPGEMDSWWSACAALFYFLLHCVCVRVWIHPLCTRQHSKFCDVSPVSEKAGILGPGFSPEPLSFPFSGGMLHTETHMCITHAPAHPHMQTHAYKHTKNQS